MDYRIKGTVAVVSGADSGIGFATAKLLLEQGARVAITDKNKKQLNEAAEKLKPAGEVFAVAADLTQPKEVDALHAAVGKQLGRARILVQAAGITGATGLFHDLTDEDWQHAIDVDFLAAVRLCRAFVPPMVEEKWGRVVLLGSEDALQPYPDELPYCAAKAAILNFAKGLSKTYAKHGVLVNAVSPAFIASPMTDAMMEKRAKKKGCSFDEAVESFLDEERPTLELRRRGKVEEVAAAIAFLCSEGASFINGANLRVDGGSVATV